MSTGFEVPGDKAGLTEKSFARTHDDESSPGRLDDDCKPVHDSTHRKLKPRHIQLIGIGGTIGTALFVSIGQGLMNGGPGSLFLAFTIW
ncbi:MAG: hypothetical protein MMC23_001712 [Stictis urceolatum]|nr:hypothetical protein [Stictis urceolata]